MDVRQDLPARFGIVAVDRMRQARRRIVRVLKDGEPVRHAIGNRVIVTCFESLGS